MIRQELRNPLRFQLREFHSLEGIQEGLIDFKFECLLVRIEAFRGAGPAFLLKVRTCFPQTPVVIVAAEIDPSALFQVRAMPQVKIISEDKEMSDLSQIIEMLTRGEDHPSRQHARTARAGEVDLLDGKTKAKLEAKFVDFAQMGARVVVNTRMPFKRNDRFQLHFESITEPGRVHRIEAVVIWQQITSGMMGTIMKGPEQTVGFRFIAAV